MFGKKKKPHWDRAIRVGTSMCWHDGYRGITNYSVGSSELPWKVWMQIHIPYYCIQIRYWIIVLAICISCLVVGFILGRL